MGGKRKCRPLEIFLFFFNFIGVKLTIFVFIISAIKGRHKLTEQAVAQTHFHSDRKEGNRGRKEEV